MRLRSGAVAPAVGELPAEGRRGLQEPWADKAPCPVSIWPGAELLPRWQDLDRVIVITDEQSSGTPQAWCPRSYIINVASYEHGVGADRGWNKINGWSEGVIPYIQTLEKEN